MPVSPVFYCKRGIDDDSRMRLAHQIRHWHCVGLCVLLCLVSLGITAAQTQTSTSSTKQPRASATSTRKKHTIHHTTTKTSASTSTHASAQKGKGTRGKRVAKKRGQMAIDPARAREIQIALIREKYMQGTPTGAWDAATQAAMQRYQADHGWQSKTTPDARALIKLGLGPSHDRLLNPESAMTTTSTTTASTKMPATPVSIDPKPGANPATPDNNLPKN